MSNSESKYPFFTKLRRNLRRIWYNLGPNDFVRCLAGGAITLISGIALIAGILLLLAVDLPDLDQLKGYEPRLTTHILDRNGELLTELFSQRRIIVTLDKMPDYTIDAFITTEDIRFYDHWGVDVLRIAGAALVDISTFSMKQGASTITQQLARDLYLHKKRTFARKIREVMTAVQIERHYSKREILEMYLTQIYFGHGAYGIQAAAQKYFSKNVTDLSIAESALLAGLPKAPEYFTPYRNPDKAIQRRNLVLKLMENSGGLTDSLFEQAVAETLTLAKGEIENPLGIAPYFTEMVRQELFKQGERSGFDYLIDGLTVKTTIDARMQRMAEAAVDSHIHEFQAAYRQRFLTKEANDISEAFYSAEVLDEDGNTTIPLDSLFADSIKVDEWFPTRAVVQVALVAMDPATGDILALIGGRDFAKYKFNRAVQAIRQPGSVFKPIVYTAAIDNGYPPTFELLNQDVVIVMDTIRWVPQNYDFSHGGLTTLREALRRSLNLVSVRLVQEVVPPRMVVKYARQMGITTPIAAVDAIALGSSGVIPIEITGVFGTFAAGGIHSEPRSIFSISDRFGTMLAEYPVKQRVALSAETAYIITDMLQTAINRGTGASVRWRWNFYPPAAGKTGTTNDFTDAWFIGFTPRLVCGVWVGLDDPAEQLGQGQSGATAALPIWGRFMKMVYDSLGYEDEPFTIPLGIIKATVCADTKKLATAYCPVKWDEVFRLDMLPGSECTKHKRRGL